MAISSWMIIFWPPTVLAMLIILEIRKFEERRMDSGKSPAPGFPRWGDLPQEVQRRILASPGLPLAKLARTCRLFREVSLERQREAETWLAEAAISFFHDSDPGIEELLRHITDFADERRELWRSVIGTLVAAGVWGAVDRVWADALMWVTSPLHMSLGRTWQMNRMQGTGSRVIGSKFMSMALDGRGSLSLCSIDPESPDSIVPCLGLLHLACKRLAGAEQEDLGLSWVSRGLRSVLVNVTTWQAGPQAVTRTGSEAAGADVQRARSAMHMREAFAFSSVTADAAERTRYFLMQC
eukprot:jgi/Botrbrau1/10855/Bobra.0025s0033.1